MPATTQATAPKTLRPFDQQDLTMFVGVETDNPLIQFEGEVAVVCDGTRLELNTNDGDVYSLDYPSWATAEAVGNAILKELAEGKDLDTILNRYALEQII